MSRVLLVVYDNGSYIHDFPHGIAYISSALKEAGHEVETYCQDVHHYTDDHLRNYLNENKFDVLGIGVIAGYYQYRKLLGMCESINQSTQRPIVVLGGHGPTPDPEYFFRKTGADYIVGGEGERAMVDLVNTLEKGGDIKDVQSVAWKDKDGKVIVNSRRALVQNIDEILPPDYEAFPMEYYRLQKYPHTGTTEFSMSMISGRGCIFKCTFCYRLDKGFRARGESALIEEMRYLRDRWGVTNVYFFDELLMVSKERTIEVAEQIKKADLGMKWSCNGRLNFATPEVLKTLKEANCVFINYGIESIDNDVLRKMKKGLTIDMIHKGIQTTLDVGISPGLNFMWGNLGDSQSTLDRTVDFLLKYDDGAQLRTIRPVTPYPGCPLYYYAIEKGFIKDCEDFYENVHMNSDLVAVNFIQDEMSTEEMHLALCDANKTLLKHYYDRLYNNMADETDKLYKELNSEFRGYRQ